MLISVLSFTVVFTFIALSHEAGHFFFAKLFGVKVFEFGIGFGKRLFSITRGETTYSINLFPVLAFVLRPLVLVLLIFQGVFLEQELLQLLIGLCLYLWSLV